MTNEQAVSLRIEKYWGTSGALDLGHLGLTEVPSVLRHLANLRSLDLMDNQLSELPRWIADFDKLEYLNVQKNQLRSLPEWLCRMSLRTLAVGQNQLRLENWLGKMSILTEIAIDGLGLVEIPPFIRGLESLERLNVRGNEIRTLPGWLRELPKLQLLYLEGNERLLIPAEILAGANTQRIFDYYFRVFESETSQPLNEFKLVLVGRGGVGKTTLVHKLTSDEFKEFDRTPGVSITKWPITIDGNEVRSHVWDFGGQEIMHGTHRFFMTERALYIVLISGREGTEDHDAEYWLSLIRSFAGDAPIIVLLHKWFEYSFELNRALLREKYGRNITFLETDSKGHGIETLRGEIGRQASTLPGLKASWPAEWRQIKEVLPASRENWLTFDDFRQFCSENGVVDQRDQEALAESLHDLGLMLSYRRDEALRHFGVLNPQWVTRGIYEMLNARELKDASGKFNVNSFAEVLDEKQYPKQLHPYLLALMRKFQLCHPLDQDGKEYLIPELLTKEEPKPDPDFAAERSLGFIYKYDAVLPEGLLPRFIVETYVFRKPKFAWRTGVILERANCRALVRGDIQGRRVDIRVTGVGNGQRELLGIVREHFERIHRTYESLPVTELVPIPGYADAYVKHELLLKYERSGRGMIAVEIGNGLKDFSVKTLLDGIDLAGAQRGARSFGAIPVFISYSRKDSVFLDQLKAALVVYERAGDLEIWYDSLIESGDRWESEISTNLDRAKIVILLLSNSFLESEYVEKELARALAREAAAECTIVPVVVRACRFEKLSVGKIQAIQPFGKPVDENEKNDRAWFEVTKELDRVIARLRER